MRRALAIAFACALAVAGVHGEARWLAGEAPRADAAYYTCAMDPAVHADRPGTCPICGMALTPVAHADRASPVVWLAAEARASAGIATAIAGPQRIAPRIASAPTAIDRSDPLRASEARPRLAIDAAFAPAQAVPIAVPARAVLYVGPRRIAFVEHDGAFAPRELQLGAASGSYVEVVRGVAAGERVVVRGQFLLAAESRLRSDSALWSGRVDTPGQPARSTP